MLWSADGDSRVSDIVYTKEMEYQDNAGTAAARLINFTKLT